MQIFKQKLITLSVIPLLLIGLVFPAQAQAAYQPQTRGEVLAYLYGQLAILQQLLTLQLEGEVGEVQGRDSSDDAEISLNTLSARNIDVDEAQLQMEIDFDNTQRATVWFEYGEQKDDLDVRTNKYSLTKTADDGSTFKVTIHDLDEGQKYYFQAVGEDNDGERVYGSIRSFTTDEEGASSNGDFSLTVDDYTIDAGDEIRVDWEVPHDESSAQNWIGLFEYGDSNYDYIDWTYLDDDDSGRVYFTIDDEGDYDVRLFLNNSYDDEVKSRRIDVN